MYIVVDVMKNYTETDIKNNFNNFIEFLKKEFKGDRLEKLLYLYSDTEYGFRTATAPATPKEFLYNCYPGGYLDHIMNVYKAAVGVKKLWDYMGSTIDFTDEELAFSALHCNLGKLGDKVGEFYLVQDNDWLIKNRGEIYKINPALQYMNIADRSLLLLQNYDIKLTQNEYLAIKLHDGMYLESNKPYLQTYIPDNELKTNLPHIIHHANHLAARAEIDEYKRQNI